MTTTNADNLKRPRRLRENPHLRDLVREITVRRDQLIMPLFVKESLQQAEPIASMPGQFQHSETSILKEVGSVVHKGVRAILLFGIPTIKDAKGSQAYEANGIIQRTIKNIKKEFKELIVITDVCLCEYTDHGHCGPVSKSGQAYKIKNDEAVTLLTKIALSHAQSGADMVAPSDMMDHRIKKIRETFDQNNFETLPILSYAVKYASAFYGPFRAAAESAPQFGDRKSYQMDPFNSDEALKEVALDLEEGADLIMVKPAMPYLDIIRRIKDQFHIPVAAYQVSGEYAMIKAAAAQGYLDEKEAVMESVAALSRAGANLMITYFAKDLAQWLD